MSRAKYEGSLERLDRLIGSCQPAVLVMEDWTGQGSRRAPRVKKLLMAARRLGLARGLVVCRYPPAMVRKTLAREGAHNKQEIAAVIAARFPELMLPLPPERKPWMSEDQRMAIFDAAGLGVTYFLSGLQRKNRLRRRGRPTSLTA